MSEQELKKEWIFEEMWGRKSQVESQNTNNQQIIKTYQFVENLRPVRFFESFDKFYILLIINNLSLIKNIHLFVPDKKSLQMLNLHFGRKYHFVKLKNGKITYF